MSPRKLDPDLPADTIMICLAALSLKTLLDLASLLSQTSGLSGIKMSWPNIEAFSFFSSFSRLELNLLVASANKLRLNLHKKFMCTSNTIQSKILSPQHPPKEYKNNDAQKCSLAGTRHDFQRIFTPQGNNLKKARLSHLPFYVRLY